MINLFGLVTRSWGRGLELMLLGAEAGRNEKPGLGREPVIQCRTAQGQQGSAFFLLIKSNDIYKVFFTLLGLLGSFV